jgi:ribose/xylose/arabinose/galactoside ABC-type transport system permease subunit
LRSLSSTRLATIQPAGGSGYELLAIGAVVIGGTSLFGGEGNVIATLIGAIIETTAAQLSCSRSALSYVLPKSVPTNDIQTVSHRRS